MTTPSTTPKALRVAAAGGFTVLALAIVLQDIIDLRDIPGMIEAWRLQHTLSLLAVFCVGFAAELTFDAYRAGRQFVGRGLLIVTTIGLALLVYNSGGRQFEAGSAKTLEAKAHNDKITAAKKRLADAVAAKAKLDTEAIKTSAEKNCARNCKDLLIASQEKAQAEIDAARAAVDALPAPVLEGSTKAIFWGDTLAPLVPRKVTLHVAERLEYVLWTLLAELGCMVSWCFVRDHPAADVPAKATTEATAELDLATLRERFFAPDNDPDPQGPPPGNRRRRQTKTGTERKVATVATVVNFPARRTSMVAETAAWSWLLDHCNRNGCLASQDTMATELGVHKGSIARWMRDWLAAGLIERTREGRRNIVRIVAPKSTASA